MSTYSIKKGSAIILPKGQSRHVLLMLGASPTRVVVSVKGGQEALELEGVELQGKNLLRLALAYPGAQVLRISKGRATPVKITVPTEIPNLIKCQNPNCVTAQPREPAEPGFHVVRTSPLTLQCTYCERYVDPKALSTLLLGP